MPQKSLEPKEAGLSTAKLPLPAFLKMLTAAGMTMPNAMAAAKTVYPTHNSPAQLSELTPVKLIQLKVSDQDQRKQILAAVKKAGYVKKATPAKRKAPESDSAEGDGGRGGGDGQPVAGPSSTGTPASSPSKRRKKKAADDGSAFSDPVPLDFAEITDEKSLLSKFTLVNRAPVMTAWATVVAERMGFKRTEALSIASVYTEMNATSKGVSLGIFDESKKRDHDGGSVQPFVELMGRRVPVMEQEENGEWRGIVKGTPVDPAVPFGYIRRSFAQTTPAVLGAMRLLAQSYEAKELNEKGYSIYCDFRPASEGWGKKSEMRMRTILGLRKAEAQATMSGGGEGAGVEGRKDADGAA